MADATTQTKTFMQDKIQTFLGYNFYSIYRKFIYIANVSWVQIIDQTIYKLSLFPHICMKKK